jgi:3-deoxy-manno-octulosonate cytidylyltransferase (CMP-KDO synthetase)
MLSHGPDLPAVHNPHCDSSKKPGGRASIRPVHAGAGQASQPFRIIIGIPARYHSTRFPGKPLAQLLGRPLIESVWRRATAVPGVERVLVATDEQRIAAAVKAFGGEAVMTRSSHRSGTDRLAEAFASIDCDLVVNLQGDEPMIHPQAIAAAIEAFYSAGERLRVSTLKTRIRARETLLDPNAVKVVTDREGFAVTFSRQPVPPVAPEDEVDLERAAYFKHLGLYVYRREFLLEFARMPRTPSETREQLEQLRMLDNGISIKVVETPHDSIGIDTPDDLARAEALLARGQV